MALFTSFNFYWALDQIFELLLKRLTQIFLRYTV